MDPTQLWAKSYRPSSGVSFSSARLLGHLQEVHEAARRVVDSTGDDQLAALGLNPPDYRQRFRRCVLLAAAVHDLGKANDHFQGMICGSRDVRQNPQGLRHEWVTVLILQELRPFLLPAVDGNECDFDLVEWAIGGHHPAHNHQNPPRTCPAGAGVNLRLCLGEDFIACLTWLGATFNPSQPLPMLTKTAWPLTGPGNAFGQFAAWFKTAQSRWEVLRRADDAKLLAALKDCLIAADVAGSALPQVAPQNPIRWDWIDKSFTERPTQNDLTQIVSGRLKDGQTPRPFQVAVQDSTPPVTYVKAGCGCGKTLAAYMWAAKQQVGRRLFFCYPTTGTATEGFKDYLFEPDVKADLFHSRRDVDFEFILNAGADSPSAESDDALRVESLDAWSTPIIACTVDTVLGIVQNNKRGLWAWPALAQSAFVFDEIHAYDDRLFGALLRFLRDLPGLPALLMTASLPTAREEALIDVLKDSRGIELAPILGPEDLETRPRYHKLLAPNNDPLPLIERELTAGGKVLWVGNTVGRVIAAADSAQHLRPMIYHSRFKYMDRVEQHKKVVAAFDPKTTGGQLAITSQVCEMSLDLKGCTLLVTDKAPVPSLIQRLGRLNRQAGSGDPTRPFVVLEPDGHLPYTPGDLDAAKAWLAKLPDEWVSQRHLAEAWEQSAENPTHLIPSAWLDGGPVTTVTELREASPGITVVLRRDLPRIRRPADLDRYTLPMPPPPRTFDWRSWPKFRAIPIVEDMAITYDAKRGAEWRKQ